MPYVMVPVPAEHEEEFGQWLLTRTLQAKLSAWPPGSVEDLYEGSDAVTRQILGQLARHDRYALEASVIGEALGLTPEDVLERIGEVNERGYAHSWPALVLVKADNQAGPSSQMSPALLMGGPARAALLRLLDD